MISLNAFKIIYLVNDETIIENFPSAGVFFQNLSQNISDIRLWPIVSFLMAILLILTTKKVDELFVKDSRLRGST